MCKIADKIHTHQKIDPSLCGSPVSVGEGMSKVEIQLTEQMAADETGLIHGGFVFGLADYAAMIAVNHPNVVLGSADVKFLKPVKVNDTITAEAQLTPAKGKKQCVDVTVKRGTETVFTGSFICFVLDQHVLG